MILQIRTQDNLEELLRNGNSYAWTISDNEVRQLKQVEIYQFDGKRVLKADFDSVRSRRTNNSRLIIAFNNRKIEESDHKWLGDSPVKYIIDDKVANRNTKVNEEYIDADEGGEMQDSHWSDGLPPPSPEIIESLRKWFSSDPAATAEEVEELLEPLQFLSWLKSYERPPLDFDFDSEYEKLHQKIFKWFFMEGWESDFEELLRQYGEQPGILLAEALSQDVPDLAYLTGRPTSENFVKLFDNMENKRIIFELFICSLVVYFQRKGFEEYEGINDWWGYLLK